MYRSVRYEDNEDAYDVDAAVDAEIGASYERRLQEIRARRFSLWYLREGRREEKQILAELGRIFGNYRRIARRHWLRGLLDRLRFLAFWTRFRRPATYADPIDII